NGFSGIVSDGTGLGLEGPGRRVSLQRGHGRDGRAAAAHLCVTGSGFTGKDYGMRRRVLTPHPGLATGIGYYLSGMEEVRAQVVAAVKTIPDDLIGKPAFLGAHSIGGLVLHIGEAEWFWMQMVA